MWNRASLLQPGDARPDRGLSSRECVESSPVISVADAREIRNRAGGGRDRYPTDALYIPFGQAPVAIMEASMDDAVDAVRYGTLYGVPNGRVGDDTVHPGRRKVGRTHQVPQQGGQRSGAGRGGFDGICRHVGRVDLDQVTVKPRGRELGK